MIWCMPSSFLIVGRIGRNDEDQVCSQVQTASVEQQWISLHAAIMCSGFDKTPTWLQTNGGREHRRGPYKQSEFNKTAWHSHPDSILSVVWVWVGNLHDMGAVSLEVHERSCDWLFGGCTLPHICLHPWLHYPILSRLDLCGIAEVFSFLVCVRWAQNDSMWDAKEWPRWEESRSLSCHWPCQVQWPEQNTRWKGKALQHLEIQNQKSQASFIVGPEGNGEFWLAPSRNLLSQNWKLLLLTSGPSGTLIFLFIKWLLSPNRFLFLTGLLPLRDARLPALLAAISM